MKPVNAAPLALLALAAVVAGCNASTTATSLTTPTPSPTPSVACTTPPGETVQLVFPPPSAPPSPVAVNSASPVPLPNAQGILIAAAPSPLPTNWFAYVILNGQTIPAIGGFLTTPPSPLPSPTVKPNVANATIQYSAFGVFATGQTYSVYLANTNCQPGISLGTFGT